MSLASLLPSILSYTQRSNTSLYLNLFLSLVGAGWLSSYVLNFGRFVWDMITPGISLKKFGAGKGAYAVVTGATAGIGRDFSLQLAKAGFNIVLLSRSIGKLQEISDEITAKYPKTKVVIHAIDYSAASKQDYAQLKTVLDPLDIGVLINNVGKSYDQPTYYQDLDPQASADIVEININATLKMTTLLLPSMIARKSGLVLTVGSFAALIPSPLLAVYSGSKSFVKTWSQALGSELKGTGVEVECLNTYFVVSKLSKISRSSWMIPQPSTYVRSVLSHIGQSGGAVGQPHISNPYFAHGLVQWFVDNFLTNAFWLNYNRDLHIDILRRVLRRREKSAKAEKEGAGGKGKKEL